MSLHGNEVSHEIRSLDKVGRWATTEDGRDSREGPKNQGNDGNVAEKLLEHWRVNEDGESPPRRSLNGKSFEADSGIK